MTWGQGASGSVSVVSTNAMAFSPSGATTTELWTPWDSSAVRTKKTSAGLSSTRKTMERFPVILSCLLLTLRKSKLEIAARSGLRFHPDAPAIALDDFLADSQANARAGVFAAAM